MHAAKRRRLTPPDSSESASPSPIDFHSTAAKWNLEQDYETLPRKTKQQKENSRLLIKTSEGWREQEPVLKPEPDELETDSFLSSEDDGIDEDEIERAEEKANIPQRQQIIEAKEELARLAGLINEDPEEHSGSLRALGQMASSENIIPIRKLALATQLAIYKDIIPGYRIRPVPEEDKSAKLSKDVRKMRDFEQALVTGYQNYVRELVKLAKGSHSRSSEAAASLATVAIGCACNLLIAVPHFNFRGELLKILVDKLSGRRVDGDFNKCRETLETIFQNDEDGNASLEAVTMLTKMMKARSYNVDESVLNTFLHLRLLSEFSFKGSQNSIDRPSDQTRSGKKMKEKREFRTKKLRKVLKERKVIEKEFKEADATVSHEERDRMQSETLKMVFVTYFRILKARSPKLMGAVLEGLARYARLINQDFFGDILEALKDLISYTETSVNIDSDEEDVEEDEKEDDTPRNATRESLLCVITAFALLQGQDGSTAASTLNLDLSFFITYLYRTLYPVSLNADIELSEKSLHLPDPHTPESQTPSTNKVNVQTTTVLLLRSLSSVLLPQAAVRSVPPVRVAAFCKALMSASLNLPERSCLAMMGLMTKVSKVHARKIGGLWNTEERCGDGVWNPLREAEGSNVFSATVWEGEILKKHFCPGVREAIQGIEKNILDA